MSKIDELLKNEKVEWKKLGDIKEIMVVSPKKKLNRKEYLEEGIYPVIDQGQSFIVGYTNDTNAAFESNKYIVFGDHTESLKYVDFPFVQGADGIKVLKTNEKYINARYLYHVISNFYEIRGEYKRHFSILKETEIPIPSLETQGKIVKILDKFTNYVTELQTELQARNKQYEYYRDLLLSEEYLKKIYYKIFESENSYYKIKTMKLGEICEINTGSKPKIVIKDEGQYKYINGGTIESGYLDSYNCDEDTVTTPSRGQGGIGFIGYQHDKFWLGALCYSIKSINKDRISNKFIYYYLSHSNHILKLKKEGGTPAINLSDLKNIRISFPILEVQNKVVEVLDKFQDLLSDTQGLLPEEIEQRQKQYEYYREKLLTFEDKSDSTPHAARRKITLRSYFATLKQACDIVGVCFAGVEWKKLGDIGAFENGTGMPKSLFNKNGSVGAIHYGHIYTKYNLFVDSPIVKVSEDNIEKLKKVNYGDLVIAKTSENVDDVMKTVAYLGNETAVTGGHSAIFRHNENPKYLSYVFNGANYLLRQKNKFARGVKVIELSISEMEKIKIPLPSLIVQDYVVSILDKFDKLVNDINEGLPKEIELRQKQYEYYRERLLNFPK